MTRRMMTLWPLRDAKARLSELLRQTERAGPQQITVHGRPTAVVVSVKDYESLTRDQPNFIDFIRQSPLFDLDLELERDKSPVREIDL